MFLSAASPVLSTEIEGQEEVKKKKKKGKMIMQCSSSVGRNFIKFIYTGKIEENILKEEAETFLELGHKYDIDSLKTMAEEEMLDILNTNNMIEFFLTGDKYGAMRLRERAKTVLKLNMKKAMEMENWK